jgi:hypothetical protein
MALTDASSPGYLPGFFQLALGSVVDSPRITEAARSGAGLGWHEHGTDVLDGCEQFFRPGYNANLSSQWLPALDEVVGKLERGALVADVGCGHGSSTILMAQAFPDSTFVGTDYHDGSIRTARQRGPRLVRGLRDRTAHRPAVPDLGDRPLAGVEVPDPLPGPPQPGGDVRPARQRPLGPAARPGVLPPADRCRRRSGRTRRNRSRTGGARILVRRRRRPDAGRAAPRADRGPGADQLGPAADR